MDSEDCVFAYDRLASLLREHRYGWVLTEVEASIALGKIKAGRAVDYEADSNSQVPGEFEVYKEVSPAFLQLMIPESAENTPSYSGRSQTKKPRRGRPVEIQKVDDFTPVEKLRMLLTATSRVFAGLPDMEISTAAILTRIEPELKGVVLEDAERAGSKAIDLLDGAKRRSDAKPLANGLKQLKEMVD